MSRPTRAVIDVSAFRANLRHARTLAPQNRVLAVVKADAYGHGAVPLARAINGEADALGVACLEEAMELRESGVNSPVVLLEGVFHPDELPLAARLHMSVVVHSTRQVDWLMDARLERPVDAWLKLDTGMHRLGMDPATFRAMHARLATSDNVGTIVLMTHFARADELQCTATAKQFSLFKATCRGLPGAMSLANSSALLAWPEARGDWTRPGIMLYGANPLDDEHPNARALRPVMCFESALISVRDLVAGESIGYGARFTASRAMRMGVVAAGYGDGYPRHARDGTPVSVNGLPARVAGRVSMDMLTIDLDDVPEARPGDRVQLWGSEVAANLVADASETIAYELFTGVTRRVPRVYSGNTDDTG